MFILMVHSTKLEPLKFVKGSDNFNFIHSCNMYLLSSIDWVNFELR